MNPFAKYPGEGRRPGGILDNPNARHVGAPSLSKRTGVQTKCAYCGRDLTQKYESWLLTTIDHVVPTEPGHKMGIKRDWLFDISNTVLCCSACNGFTCKTRLKDKELPQTEEEFFVLRDEVFEEKRRRCLDRHEEEQAFFESKPWLPK